MNQFEIFDSKLNKTYKAKVFLFEDVLFCTEIDGSSTKLIYREKIDVCEILYVYSKIDEGCFTISLLNKDLSFSSDILTIQEWIKILGSNSTQG